MDPITLDAMPRESGKKETKAVRRSGHVPCVLYGHDVETVHFQVPDLSLRPLIYTNETHLVTVSLNGQSWDCFLKHVDFHPVTDRPLHADFQVLIEGEKVRLTVPIRFIGTPVGQIAGGNTQYVLQEVDIKCLPRDIPSAIQVDVSKLRIGDSIHIGDLDLEGLEFQVLDRQTIVTVTASRVVLPEDEEEEEGEEGEEGVEGEEGEEGEASGEETAEDEA